MIKLRLGMVTLVMACSINLRKYAIFICRHLPEMTNYIFHFECNHRKVLVSKMIIVY